MALVYDPRRRSYLGGRHEIPADLFEDVLAALTAGGVDPDTARELALEEEVWDAQPEQTFSGPRQSASPARTAEREPSPPARSPDRSRGCPRWPVLAALLQCLPLLALFVLVNATGLLQPADFLPFALWGFGYLYAGQARRFLIALIIGPVVLMQVTGLTFLLGLAILGDRSWDFLWFPFIGVPLALALGVTATAVDAWRLARAHNRRLTGAG